MKKFAVILIIISVIVSSLIAVQTQNNINWSYFIPSLLLGILALVFLKILSKKEKKQAVSNDTSFEDHCIILKNIIASFNKLIIDKSTLESFNKNLDNLFIEDINKFLDSRYLIKYKYGVLSFSNIMSHFAAAERLLNRAWSASVDGYIEEVQNSIEASKSEFILCLNEYENLIKS